MSDDREAEIKSKTVQCVCGATGIAYDLQAWEENATYWELQGMWGNAETEKSQCEDCYPMSYKNMCKMYGEDTFRKAITPAFEQSMQLKEMGLSMSEATEVVFNAIDPRRDNV